MAYLEQTFGVPELDGISKKSVEEHIDLYKGYVKNFNAISDLLAQYGKEPQKNSHVLAELIRRRSFEFGGMRLHELYFPQFEGSSAPLTPGGSFAKELEKKYQKVEYFFEYFKTVASIRGPGWALLYFDPAQKELLTGFSGEQHQGHFAGLPILLALDVWEHAYILDYGALGRGKYVDAFFKNLNWSVVESRFDKASAQKA